MTLNNHPVLSPVEICPTDQPNSKTSFVVLETSPPSTPFVLEQHSLGTTLHVANSPTSSVSQKKTKALIHTYNTNTSDVISNSDLHKDPILSNINNGVFNDLDKLIRFLFNTLDINLIVSRKLIYNLENFDTIDLTATSLESVKGLTCQSNHIYFHTNEPSFAENLRARFLAAKF